MRTFTIFFCALFALVAVACGQTGAASNQQSSESGSPSTGSATTADGAATAPPPKDLLSIAAGTQIVEKPESNRGIFVMAFDPINLIDEAKMTDWLDSPFNGTSAIVFKFPEQTEVEKLVFDSAGLSNDDKTPKSITVEISDTSATEGFKSILATDLAKATDNQTFPVSAKIAGRWLRFTVKSNHGSSDALGMGAIHAYGRQLTNTAKVENVSGTYEGTSGWGKLRLKQEGIRITGCYDYQNGIFAGGIEGNLIKVTAIQDDAAGNKERLLGLFSFTDDKRIFGLTRGEEAVPDHGWGDYFSGERISDDIGDCPNIPGWKGNAAQSQLSSELEAKGRARLDGVNFDFNSATIRSESKPLLDQVAALLKAHPDWSITLEGHTDNVGTAAFNQDLSARRAAAVKDYLVSAGVPLDRLKSVGFGFDKPVASNAGEGGRAQNRRVEIVKG